MAIEVTRVPNADAEAPGERLVALQVIGTLHKSDLETLREQLELQFELHGTLRLFIELVDFEGLTAGAAWEDLKLAVRHFRDVERIAVVGESDWEKEITNLARLFTAAEVRYFDLESRDEAEAWAEAA